MDDVAIGLTAEHRARIEAVLAPEGKVMTPEAWAELEYIVGYYRIWERSRTTYPLTNERKRWKRLGDAVEKAAAELRQLRRDTPWFGTDPGWINRGLAALWEVHDYVERRAKFHKIWGSPFSGQENQHREFLYGEIMRVWTDHLGGELQYSKSDKKKPPSGPLIRFLVACVEPILGDKTPGGGLGDIIDREREVRAKIKDEKRQWRERRGF